MNEPAKPDDSQRVIEQQKKRAEQEAKADDQPSQDPQLRRVHDGARSPDEGGRGVDTSMEDGGARHRQR
jgi:hypothetical protein